MRRVPIAIVLVLLASCGAAADEAPEPPIAREPDPVVAPAARAPIPIVVTNEGTSEVTIDASLDLGAIDVEGALAPVGLHMPPHACECACEAAECPCASPPAPTTLAPGASVERTWDGALRVLRRGPTGAPCHERLDPPPGRYVVVACDASGVRCGTAEVALPAFEPIAIALPEAILQPSCEDVGRLRRAVRIALGAARLEGVESAVIEACDAVAASCVPAGAERAAGWGSGDAEPPPRCDVAVSVGDARYEVRVRPAARDGAPIAIEAWVGAPAVDGPGRVDVAPTRWAVSADGMILIAGVPERVSHTHGGRPAQIGRARFRVTNRSDVAVPLGVTRAEWIDTGRAREVAARGVEPASIPPRGTVEIEVLFDAQPAYYTWRERFASSVTFDVGGRALTATVEHHVLRREPLGSR